MSWEMQGTSSRASGICLGRRSLARMKAMGPETGHGEKDSAMMVEKPDKIAAGGAA